MFKNKLEQVCHKRKLPLPKYTTISTTLDSKLRSTSEASPSTALTFASLPRRLRVRQQESPLNISMPNLYLLPLDIPLFFKSMLQDLVQKQCLSSPVYATVMNGPSHLPAFVSTVKVEGEKFVGVCATTKKQAEQNSAKVAFQKFKECERSRRSQCSLFQVQEEFKPVSLVGPKVTAESQQLGVSSILISCNGESTKSRNEIDFEIAQTDADNATNAKPLNSNGVALYLLASSSIKSNTEPSASTVDLKSGSCVDACLESSTRVLLDISEFEYSQQKESISINLLPSKHGISSTTSTFEDSDRYAAEVGHSLKRNRITIYPRNSGVVLPQGATVMPCSDEKWLALSFDSSKE